MAATIPVAVGSGLELTQGSLLRYLNEVMFFPSAFGSEFITWEAIDETSARSTLNHAGQDVSAVWYFDDQGRIVNMVAERYYSHPGGNYSMETWETPITGYAEFDGIRIPSAELYLRAAAMATFCPIMYYHSEYNHHQSSNDRTPLNIAECTQNSEVITIFRYFARLRMNLLPYILHTARNSASTGLPMMRALSLVYPGDEMVSLYPYQYLFGDMLLVAPIVESGLSTTEDNLPERG